MTEQIQRFFNVAARPSTYGNVAYVWLAFPLGIAYFVLLVTGSALSVGLSLLWIGLVVMIALLLSIRGLGDFERVLAKWLLGESFTARAWPARSQRFFPWLGSLVKDSTTWKGALFLLVKFPIGIACWVVSVTTFAVSAAFLAAPLEYGGRIYVGDFVIHDPTGGFLISAVGALLLIVTLHLHNAMGALWRFMGRQLLATAA